MVRRPRRLAGMTLVEVVIALGLASFLLLGVVAVASATSASTRLQRNQAQLQEHARLAVNTLSAAVREAGFSPEPWNEAFAALGISELTADDAVFGSDRLAVRTWSDRNCFGSRNPDTGPDGDPLFYIRESRFDLNGGGGLTRHCLYGPALSELVPQIRRQGLIQGVDSFQVLYARDSDRDGTADGWVRGGEWAGEENVLAVRVGLLLVSEDAVAEPAPRTFEVLDRIVSKRGDGRIRRLVQFTVALKGRSG